MEEADLPRAAVAAVFCAGDHGTELLLIRRAEDERDPWSGHIALPGGRMDPDDRDLRATAIRETREELGFELEGDAFLGRFDEIRAIARARRIPPSAGPVSPFPNTAGSVAPPQRRPDIASSGRLASDARSSAQEARDVRRSHLAITPFVFWLDRRPTTRRNYEVAEVLWTPVEPLVDGRADAERPYEHEGQILRLPAFAIGEHLVWGLTYQMLSTLFRVVREP